MDAQLQEQIDQATDAGRLWEARDLLKKRASETDCCPEVWEQLGRVLLAMRDECEAGRWLFFSGAEDPAYTDAINTFLAEYPPDTKLFHSRVPGYDFHEGVDVSHLPASVQARLCDLDFGKGRGERMSVRETVIPAFVLIVIVAIIYAFGTGVVQILKWVF